MPSVLTESHITSVMDSLPIQGRIMLKLLLLQHYDLTEEDINYIAADRPDPRCVSGTKPTNLVITQDTLKSVHSRRDEYRRRVRLRRERLWLQMECMKRMAALAEAMVEAATHLLQTKFQVTPESIAALKQQARTAVPKPVIRLLERRWDENDITAEAFQEARLGIELQTQLRLLEKYRKRFELSEREWKTINAAPMQDHEIGHIWGIPAGTLAARKVKFLSQYLLATQARCSDTPVSGSPAPSPEMWQATLRALAQTPIERSIATYDGLEGTESALIEKLEIYAMMGISEATETKFWNSLVYGASSNAIHTETTRTLFGLQRLVSIQKDLDTSNAALDEELLKRSRPTPKAGELPAPAPESGQGELTDFQRHILHNFIGEDVSGRSSDKW